MQDAMQRSKKDGKALEDQALNRRRVVWLNHESVTEKRRQREADRIAEQERKEAEKKAREEAKAHRAEDKTRRLEDRKRKREEREREKEERARKRAEKAAAKTRKQPRVSLAKAPRTSRRDCKIVPPSRYEN